MTEKRFTSKVYNVDYYTEIIDNRKKLDPAIYNPRLLIREAVDLLNYLSEENEQLKHDATVLIRANTDYRRENKQLKEKLKIYRKIANCSNCDYHNYDWFDDGDEFEVCDKGNDMSNRICQDWEEL